MGEEATVSRDSVTKHSQIGISVKVMVYSLEYGGFTGNPRGMAPANAECFTDQATRPKWGLGENGDLWGVGFSEVPIREGP